MSPSYYTENTKNEEASFKSVREFSMVNSMFTFSHIGETQTENVSEHKIFDNTHTHTHIIEVALSQIGFIKVLTLEINIFFVIRLDYRSSFQGLWGKSL